MVTQSNEVETEQVLHALPRAVTPRNAFAYPLPHSMVMTERATALLRAELARRGSGDWIIFYNLHHELHALETHLEELEETTAWEPLPGLAGGETIDSLTCGETTAKRWPSGLLYLEKHQVALARWFWAYSETSKRRSLYLVATAFSEHFHKLRSKLAALCRESTAPVWQVIHGGYDDAETISRKIDGPEIMLSDALRKRIDIDVLRFFSAEVIELYRTLGVPHRRGLLLYGPPGNGKTSLIRRIGAMIPDVPGLVLRASAGFDSDDLEAVIKRWTNLAPAILVIEDLDWLLKTVNMSTLLNSLDGISTSAKGMLLIATTNHPDRLDPAINNRPGRFDVSIEMPNPDRELREAFFLARLNTLPAESAIAVAAPMHAPLRNSDPQNQLNWIMSHPSDFLRALLRTIPLQFGTIVWSCIGILGHLHTKLSPVFVGAYMLVAVVAAINDPSEAVRVSLATRAASAAAVLISTGLVFTCEYLVWNKTGNPFIEGVQGRYFIPMALAAMIVIHRKGMPGVRPMLTKAVIVLSCIYMISAVIWRYY
jgi:hypothetical protein